MAKCGGCGGSGFNRKTGRYCTTCQGTGDVLVKRLPKRKGRK